MDNKPVSGQAARDYSKIDIPLRTYDVSKMALKLAAQFIAKGIEMKAYKGCVMSGEHALKVIENALEDLRSRQGND